MDHINGAIISYDHDRIGLKKNIELETNEFKLTLISEGVIDHTKYGRVVYDTSTKIQFNVEHIKGFSVKPLYFSNYNLNDEGVGVIGN